MKPKAALPVLVAALLIPAAASADGLIYNTDILAVVNGEKIRSFNTGEKTAVLVNDLTDERSFSGLGYGFYKQEREDAIYIYNITHTETPPELLAVQKPYIDRGTNDGGIAGEYHDSNANIFVNNCKIPAYTINGELAVCIEDIGAITESSPNASYGWSAALCKTEYNNEIRTVYLRSCQESYYSEIKTSVPRTAVSLENNNVSVSFNRLNLYYPYGSAEPMKISFSEEFKSERFCLKPLYLGSEEIGSMYLNESGIPRYCYDKDALDAVGMKLANVLTFDEAKKYMYDNCEIMFEHETASAVIYCVKDGDTQRIVYALKNGGLMCRYLFNKDDNMTIQLKDGLPYMEYYEKMDDGDQLRSKYLEDCSDVDLNYTLDYKIAGWSPVWRGDMRINNK